MKNTTYGGEVAARLLRGARGIHMLGIGGVGMSALAMIMVSKGYRITGEDRVVSPVTQALAERGISVSDRHKGLALECGALVYSAAISPSHPAFAEAKEKGIPIMSRSDLLAFLMLESPRRVTVAGIHGKSTVTAMLDKILSDAGQSPTTVSGATLSNQMTYRLGQGDVFLAEACEYTDSFLSFSPTLAIALNLEHDHPDYFKDEAAIRASFARYLSGASEGAILPAFGPLVSLAPRGLSVKTFGRGGDLSGELIGEREDGIDFSMAYQGKNICAVHLPLLGAYQMDNALAAILSAKELGVPFESSAKALSDFVSPDRRCKEHPSIDGVRYFEDYAHHPSEIKAILLALRNITKGRLICAFEAHTYSRLARFFDRYREALSLSDFVLVLPIYPARETDTLGQSEIKLSAALSVPSRAAFDYSEAAEILKESTASGDTVAVLGAGDTRLLFEKLLN
ncbi:MAG: hypothetical protein IKT72_06680 [Clostridia bacterium]|nr:hypothetical protein [Clostridia bacterium]